MHIDNVHPGDWVVVVGFIEPDMTYEQRNQYWPPTFTGEPVLVSGVSAPFVSGYMPGSDEITTIDTKQYIISKVKQRKRKKSFVHESRCPHCNEGSFVSVRPANGPQYFRCKVCETVAITDIEAKKLHSCFRK